MKLCWLIIEDDDGLTVVGQGFKDTTRTTRAAILAEMKINADLADVDGSARAWVLTQGTPPRLHSFSNQEMDTLRQRHHKQEGI